MKRYALLCGSAPDGKIQKKIDSMYESLAEENGGMFAENEIMIFPNGIDEEMLSYVMARLRMGGTESVFVYVCTVTPVLDYEKSVWLGGNEIRKAVLEQSDVDAGFVQAQGDSEKPFSVQVVYGADCEFVDDGEYYLDEERAEI